jgi:hypothetical protein
MENLEMFPDMPAAPEPTAFCSTCGHRQRWQCNSKVIQYCGVRKSNRTQNGLLKIKVHYPACEFYVEKQKEPA